jgi:hypothetical protein
MGSTAQSTSITPSTFVGGITQGAILYFKAVTSSGVYFTVGDASRVIIFVSNGSSSDTGAVFIEPGGNWSGARRGIYGISTGSSVYSTATTPVAVSVATHAKSDYSAAMSTAGSFVAIGPLDSAQVKSSDGLVYLIASTGSTRMCAAVYALEGS